MNEHPGEEDSLVWPERYLDAASAPPLARTFVKQIESFEPASAMAPARAPRWPLALGVGFAAIAAAVVLYVKLAPSESEVALLADAPAAPIPVTTPPAMPGSGTPWPPPLPTTTGNPMTTPPATPIETGTLRVVADPWVDVMIDGTRHGVTPVDATLPAGTHTLRLTRRDHGIDEVETITIAPGDTLELTRRFELEEAPPPPPSAPVPDADRYAAARACAVSGDHRCVIDLLEGHATAAREFELLIASLRHSSGRDREVESAMRTYLSRFPTGRQAAAYRQYLVAHSGG